MLPCVSHELVEWHMRATLVSMRMCDKVIVGLMYRIIVIALIAVGLVPLVLAEDQPDSTRLFLGELNTQRSTVINDPSRATTNKPQTDLTPLLGVGRNELVQLLGEPDFCVAPRNGVCSGSPHLTYFFFPYQPPSARDVGGGMTEITASAGGGWALEIDVTHNAVGKAYWVRQE